MKTKLLICLLLLKSSFGFSQNDSTAYQQFFNRVVTLYTAFSKPPLKNYYDVLSKTALFSFNTYNPAFLNALQQIKKESNQPESVALDTLFNRVFADLNAGYLWINAADIFNTKKELFQVYNEFFCPCITAKIKRTDRMEKVAIATEACFASLIKDTAFANNIRRSSGNNTLNDIYNLREYISFYIYNNCSILNYQFNETIRHEPVYTQYYTGLSMLKAKEAENVINYFKKKKMDSLAIIFPGYKKYLPELKKIIALVGGKDVVLRSSYYFKSSDSKNPSVDISCFKNKTSFRPFGRVEFDLSEASLDARFVNVKYLVEKNTVNKDEMIEEIIIGPAEKKPGGH